jgi:plasmid stabilization system protein ParE
MVRRLVIRSDAAAELDQVYDYIAEQSGPERAWGYIIAIRSFLVDLCHYPERGSLRDGTVAGLRIIGFRRSLSIAFVARAEDVLVLGFFYAGRNFDEALIGQRVHPPENS